MLQLAHAVYPLGMAIRIYLPMRIDADIALYPTYVGYSAIYADIGADIRICMAFPGTHRI